MIYKEWKTKMIERKINSKWQVFIMGIIIGCIVFLGLYGYKVLNVTYDEWLINDGGDLSQHYLGWMYYRNTPWKFPIGLIQGITYPTEFSVVYMDAIPICAVFFKLLSPILPTTFQYFGIFGLLVYMMQGGISAILLYSKTRNEKVSVLGSAFFVLSSVLLTRMFGHTALACHPIILIALYIFLNKEKFKEKNKDVVYWTILLSISSLIHIYFVPMVVIFICGFYMSDIFSKDFFKAFLKVIIPIGVTLLVMWIIGYFYGKSDLIDYGFGVYNANLNALFNDQGTSFFAKLLNQTSTGVGEGYAYLGLGIILLVFLCIVTFLQNIKVRDIHIGKFIPIISIVCVCLFLSIQPIIRFGEFTIVKIHYPQKIESVLAMFRANGRFIWPIFYLIMVASLCYVFKNYRKYSLYIIGALLIVQIIDLSPVISSRKNLVEKSEDIFQSTAWDKISAKEVFFCYDPMQSPKMLKKTFRLGKYAADHEMVMNDFYVSRKYADEIVENRKEQMKKILSGEVDEDKLYIFSDIPIALLDNKDIHIYDIDNTIIGIKSEIEGEEEISIDDEIQLINSNSYKFSQGKESGSEKILDPEGILYGPYIPISKGKYYISIKGDNLDNGDYDVVGNGGEEKFALDELTISDSEVNYYLNIEKLCDDIEIRCVNTGKAEMLFSSISIKKIQ